MLPKPGSGRKLNLSISAIKLQNNSKGGSIKEVAPVATSASGVEDALPCMPRVLWGDNASPVPQQQPELPLDLPLHGAEAQRHPPMAAAAAAAPEDATALSQVEPVHPVPNAAAECGSSPDMPRRRPRRSRTSGQPMLDPGAAWDMRQFMTSSQQELQQMQAAIAKEQLEMTATKRAAGAFAGVRRLGQQQSQDEQHWEDGMQVASQQEQLTVQQDVYAGPWRCDPHLPQQQESDQQHSEQQQESEHQDLEQQQQALLKDVTNQQSSWGLGGSGPADKWPPGSAAARLSCLLAKGSLQLGGSRRRLVAPPTEEQQEQQAAGMDPTICLQQQQAGSTQQQQQDQAPGATQDLHTVLGTVFGGAAAGPAVTSRFKQPRLISHTAATAAGAAGTALSTAGGSSGTMRPTGLSYAQAQQQLYQKKRQKELLDELREAQLLAATAPRTLQQRVAGEALQPLPAANQQQQQQQQQPPPPPQWKQRGQGAGGIEDEVDIISSGDSDSDFQLPRRQQQQQQQQPPASRFAALQQQQQQCTPATGVGYRQPMQPPSAGAPSSHVPPCQQQPQDHPHSGRRSSLAALLEPAGSCLQPRATNLQQQDLETWGAPGKQPAAPRALLQQPGMAGGSAAAAGDARHSPLPLSLVSPPAAGQGPQQSSTGGVGSSIRQRPRNGCVPTPMAGSNGPAWVTPVPPQGPAGPLHMPPAAAAPVGYGLPGPALDLQEQQTHHHHQQQQQQQAWWWVLPDFVPVQVLAERGVNPRDGQPVHIHYRHQFEETGGPVTGGSAAAGPGRGAGATSSAAKRRRTSSVAAGGDGDSQGGMGEPGGWLQQAGGSSRKGGRSSGKGKKRRSSAPGKTPGGRKAGGKWTTDADGTKVFKDAKGRALRGSAAYLQWQNSRGGN